jgi:hypothetical protein
MENGIGEPFNSDGGVMLSQELNFVDELVPDCVLVGLVALAEFENCELVGLVALAEFENCELVGLVALANLKIVNWLVMPCSIYCRRMELVYH